MVPKIRLKNDLKIPCLAAAESELDWLLVLKTDAGVTEEEEEEEAETDGEEDGDKGEEKELPWVITDDEEDGEGEDGSNEATLLLLFGKTLEEVLPFALEGDGGNGIEADLLRSWSKDEDEEAATAKCPGEFTGELNVPAVVLRCNFLLGS